MQKGHSKSSNTLRVAELDAGVGNIICFVALFLIRSTSYITAFGDVPSRSELALENTNLFAYTNVKQFIRPRTSFISKM